MLGTTACKYVDGELAEVFRHQCELEPTSIDMEDPFIHLQFAPANGQGKSSLVSFHHPSFNEEIQDIEVRGSIVYFDSISERFSVTKWPGGSNRTIQDIWLDWERSDYSAKPFIWDGLVYYHLPGPFVRFAHAEDEETRLKRPGAIQYLPFDSQWVEDDEDTTGLLWGDDRFLVLRTEAGYTVWSFDETLDISGSGWKTWENAKEAVTEVHDMMEIRTARLQYEARARRDTAFEIT